MKQPLLDRAHHIGGIQALRALSALMVVFCHTGLLVLPLSERLFYWLGAAGYAGVDMFFVISGFVVSGVASRTTQTMPGPRGAWDFALRRIFRIYPLWWVIFIVATLAGPLLNNALAHPHPTYPPIFSFLLMDERNSALKIAWTLAYEMYFYAVLTGIVLLSGRYFTRVMDIAAAAYAALLVYVSVTFTPLTLLPINPVILDFLMGYLVFRLYQSGWLFRGWTVTIVAAFLIVASVSYLSLNPTIAINHLRPWFLGVPAALLLYGVVARERQGYRVPKLALLLGDASYSIYLWHLMVILALDPLARQLHPIAGSLVLAALSVLVGVASFWLIERPAARLLTPLRRRLAPFEPGSGPPDGLPPAKAVQL